MDQLERDIRDSLRARSADVEPTPDLWASVERRVTRRRWLTVAAVAGAAAAVVAAATVVPGLLRTPPTPAIVDQPSDAATVTPTEDGSESATESPPVSGPDDGGVPIDPAPTTAATEPGARSSLPAWYVAVEDRLRVTVRSSDDDEIVAVVREAVTSLELETIVQAVAVRPGSSPDDLVLAVSRLGEGDQWVELWEYDGEDLTVRVVWYTNDDLGRIPMTLAWAEDGTHVAFATPGGIRVAGIEEMLAVGSEPDDIGDVGQTLSAGLAANEVVDWYWTERDCCLRAIGTIELSSGDAAASVDVERRGDGGIDLVAVRGGPSQRLHGAADSHLSPGAAVGPSYTLDVVDGRLQLTWSSEGDRDGRVELGGDLTDDPSVWMNAYGDGVVVGKTDGVWLAVREGTSRRLPDPVAFAALVPLDAG